MVKKTIKVGLLGLGTVGAGVYRLLQMNGAQINRRAGAQIEIKKILVRDPGKKRTTEVDAGLLTVNPREILHDPEIDVVVELIGGVEEARTYVEEALQHKKFVVTANKDLLATAGTGLLQLAREKGLNIYYEASVGGGIPLIRPLKYCLGANKIARIMGIINGTTNYILTKMSLEGMEFEAALAEAQAKGFAEQDPGNDLEGRDAAYKLCILAGLAFSSRVRYEDIFIQGIGGINKRDILYARELGFTVKLLAVGEEFAERGLALRVYPALLPLTHPLASVFYENNALFVEGNAVGEVMFYGPGAGALPTASAVAADLIAVVRNINHRVENGIMEADFEQKNVVPVESLSSAFYLRLQAQDEPGVFASLATAFGKENVSLDQILQKRNVAGTAEIVLVTHVVEEKSFNLALNRIQKTPAIKRIDNVLRVIES
ncbi:MAG: homoserine dehydrogenase [Firmicutes bacterium]|nr:homoserine dehydrogenase [Bacillota bacterium]